MLYTQSMDGRSRLLGAEDIPDPSEGSLKSLTAAGLLLVSYSPHGDQEYFPTDLGVKFVQWLSEQVGEPIDRIEDEVISLVDGAAFATTHPGAARHLSDAFRMSAAGDLSDQAVSAIGAHLRGALFDIVADVEPSSQREDPDGALRKRLSRKIKDGSFTSDRERNALQSLVSLTASVLQLDQRLTHQRDQVDGSNDPVSLTEMRRACWLTAITCYDVARL